MYIQDENFNRRTWTEEELAENGPPETTRISKFEAKRRATVLYISITLYYAIASKKYGVMLEGCMGQRYSTQLGGSQSLKGFERIILVATGRLVVRKYT